MNDTEYSVDTLMMGMLPGHNATQRTILIINPVNNTEYVCRSILERGVPYHIFIAGECLKLTYVHNNYITMYCYIADRLTIPYTYV